MARTKKVEEVPKTTKKTPVKETTKKAPRKTVVDTTAVEVPVEEAPKEPEIEAEKVLTPDEEIFNQISKRYYNISDIEKEAAAKIFQDTKEGLKDKFAENNVNLIAAATADAALTVMSSINKEAQRTERMKKSIELRNERKNERAKEREQRRNNRIERRETRSKSREERKAALYGTINN